MTKRRNITGKSITLKNYANVQDTIEAIRRIILDNYMIPEIEHLADLLQGRDDEDTFRNIWNWVRHNINYQNDANGKEQLRRPQRTLNDRTGDCDDMTILISSILMNLNYSHELIIAAYKKKNAWQHIYPAVYDMHGNRFVIDCVPEVPHFNYEAKPIINQILIDMKLEELGFYEGEQSPESDMLEEILSPFNANEFAGLDSDEDFVTIQGMLGNVVLVDEDDEYDTILSGSSLSKNILLRQLVDAVNALKKEVAYPTDLSQLNDNRSEIRLVENIIDNFYDEDARDDAIDQAINKNTLYKNFYKSIRFGLEDSLSGLSGDDDDAYYLKIMEEEGLLDDLLEEDDLEGYLGRRSRRGGFKKFKSKIKSKVKDFKTKHPKLAKVGNMIKKFSPTGIAIRSTLATFLGANALGFAEKLAVGYASESEAKKLGFSSSEWKKFVEAKNKFAEKWKNLGGSDSVLKKLITKGRGGRKAGLKGELGIAPAIISAVSKALGFVFDLIKNLKMKKQEKKDAAAAASGGGSSSNGGPGSPGSGGGYKSAPGEDAAYDEYSDEGSDGSGGETDEKSGVVTETVTDENGNEKKVYKDKEGNEISKWKALFLKNKMIIIIVGCVLVVGIVALIIWKIRKAKSMQGLGSGAGISAKQENFIKRQQLNNRAYASLVREEISKDGKKNTSGNRRKYYKNIFKESFARKLSPKQVSAATRFNSLYSRVRQLAKSFGGGSTGWRRAWKEVKKKT